MRTHLALFVSTALLAFGCNARKASVQPEAGTAPIVSIEPPVTPEPRATTSAPATSEALRAAPPASAPRAAPTKRPQNEQACKACGGVWARHGIAETPSCNCATSDGGKRCKDGLECEGVCAAAEEPERDVVDPGPPPRGFFVGRCSKNVTIFGCYRPIERGASATHVDLTTPPQMICAD